MTMTPFVLLCWRNIRSLPLGVGSLLSISPPHTRAQTLAQRFQLLAACYVTIDDDLFKKNHQKGSTLHPSFNSGCVSSRMWAGAPWGPTGVLVISVEMLEGAKLCDPVSKC